jgi:hypothetical protein
MICSRARQPPSRKRNYRRTLAADRIVLRIEVDECTLAARR